MQLYYTGLLNLVVKEKLDIIATEELILEMLLQHTFTDEDIAHRAKIKLFFKDISLFENTLKESLNVLKQTGIDTKYISQEDDIGYHIAIRIVKNH